MKAPTDNTLLCVSLLTALLLFTADSLSQISEPAGKLELPEQVIPEPPSNWYQVELVLFTQQGNRGLESPPKDYHLQFPDNWLELNQGITPMSAIDLSLIGDISHGLLLDGEVPFSATNLALFSNNLNLAAAEKIPNEPELSRPIPEASIPYQHHQQEGIEPMVASEIEVESPQEMPEPFIPQYEKPYQILEAEYRDLNESAAALDRRQYNVVLHQAWRMPIQQSEVSPWVLVKAGPTATERYVIEGAVRFYKSRFLHFETNLWHLKVANDQSNLLQLPDIPKTPLSAHQTVTLNAQAFSERLENLALVPTNSNQVESGSDNQQTAANQYPIEALWVMNKSQRLQQDQVYYLDHPEMGALVTIKAYVPSLLNPPPALSTDIESTALTELEVTAPAQSAATR